MPITNVQSCRAGHAEYPHLNLPHFLIDRQAPLMVGLLVVGVAPRLLGLSAGWRALSLGWAASTSSVASPLPKCSTILVAVLGPTPSTVLARNAATAADEVAILSSASGVHVATASCSP